MKLRSRIENFLWRYRWYKIRLTRKIVNEVARERRLERQKEHDDWLSSTLYKTHSPKMGQWVTDSEIEKK